MKFGQSVKQHGLQGYGKDSTLQGGVSWANERSKWATGKTQQVWDKNSEWNNNHKAGFR